MSPLSRRHLVTTAAALPALAVPAVACTFAREPDPIFAAIEKYRELDAVFIARCHYEDNLAECGRELASAPGDSRTSEMVAVVTAVRAARAELAKTVPTTLAGMAAYLDYVLSESIKIDDFLFESAGGDPAETDEAVNFLRSLATCARQIAPEAVQS